MQDNWNKLSDNVRISVQKKVSGRIVTGSLPFVKTEDVFLFYNVDIPLLDMMCIHTNQNKR